MTYYHVQPIAKHYVGGVEEDYVFYCENFDSRTQKNVNEKITVGFSHHSKNTSDELDSVEVKNMI